jgi:hypothetical protein
MQWARDRTAKPGVGDGYHLHPDGAAIEVPGEAVFCALGGTHLERTITTSTLRDSLRPR